MQNSWGAAYGVTGLLNYQACINLYNMENNQAAAPRILDSTSELSYEFKEVLSKNQHNINDPKFQIEEASEPEYDSENQGLPGEKIDCYVYENE